MNWATPYPERIDLITEGLFHPFTPLKRLPVHVGHFVAVPAKNDELASFHETSLEFIQCLCKMLKCGDGPSDVATIYEEEFDRGNYTLRWEKHSKFQSYTFVRYTLPQNETIKEHFDVIKEVMSKILIKGVNGIPGNLLVALNIILQKPKDLQQLYPPLGTNPGLCSDVLGGRARVQTDFDLIIPRTDLQSNLILVEVKNSYTDINKAEAALLIQRLLVVETRRMMALFELSETKMHEILENIDSYEKKLELLVNDVVEHLQRHETDTNLIQDHLKKAIDLSDKIEHSIVTNASNLSGAQVHMATAIEFIDDLEEKESFGFMTLKQFLHRSIDPAIQTNRIISDRLEHLSQHASNVIDVLRTQIESESLQKDSQINIVLFFLTVFAFCYYSAELLHHSIDSIWDIFGLPKTLAGFSADSVIRIVSIVSVVSVAVAFLFSKRFRFKSLKFQIKKQRDIHEVFSVAEQQLVEGTIMATVLRLIKSLTNPNQDIRRGAARDLSNIRRQLGKIRQKTLRNDVAPTLIKSLEDASDKEVRGNIASVLGEIPIQESVSALEKALGDSDPTVRKNVAAALARIGPMALTFSDTLSQRLQNMSYSDERQVRRECKRALRTLGFQA